MKSSAETHHLGSVAERRGRYLRDDVLHVTSWVVGAVIVAEAVQDGLRFELVLVGGWGFKHNQ